MVGPDGPVNLLYVPAPGFLMEPVNVLGNDTGQSSRQFQLCKGQMRPVRQGGSGIQIFAVVVEKELRLFLQTFAAEQIFRLIAQETFGPFLYRPFLLLKSGMPLSVDTPAPPRNTVLSDSKRMSQKASYFCSAVRLL